MKRGTFPFIILGFLDIIISISGLYIWRILSGKSSTVLVMTSILLALSTYFGFVAISQSLGKGPTSNMGSIRTAIASGILVLYFFICSISIFASPENVHPLSEFGETMIQNFTTLLGIIIPFYFGASAYVQVHKSTRNKKDDQSDSDVPNDD